MITRTSRVPWSSFLIIRDRSRKLELFLQVRVRFPHGVSQNVTQHGVLKKMKLLKHSYKETSVLHCLYEYNENNVRNYILH